MLEHIESLQFWPCPHITFFMLCFGPSRLRTYQYLVLVCCFVCWQLFFFLSIFIFYFFKVFFFNFYLFFLFFKSFVRFFFLSFVVYLLFELTVGSFFSFFCCCCLCFFSVLLWLQTLMTVLSIFACLNKLNWIEIGRTNLIVHRDIMSYNPTSFDNILMLSPRRNG